MENVAPLDQQRLFFATGRRHGAGVEPIDGLKLAPAVLARYRDLAKLRYDFPLVLVDEGAEAGTIRSPTIVSSRHSSRTPTTPVGG